VAIRDGSLLSERVVADVTRMAHAGLGAEEVLNQTAAALARAVPFDAWCASTVDPASLLLTLGVADGFDETVGGEPAGHVFLDRISFEEDLRQIPEMLRERRTVSLLSETTRGELESSLRYRELLRPHRFRHQAGVLFVDRCLWGSMDLIRDEGRPDFTTDEVTLIRRVAPHVGSSLRAATLRTKAATATDEDAPGVLTIDAAGRIVMATPAAEHYLADLGSLDPGWRHGRDLPIGVRMVATALDAALAPRVDGDRDLLPRLRAKGRSGRWLSLHASRTEPALGRPSETVIVIGPAGSEEMTWLNVAAYGLSAREEAVIRQVIRGHSTKQIAAELFIAEHTVQRHLTNIFDKVGVRSRRELLKRLFFEQFAPSLAPG
jgi:DNA-binding CsgD family transcriptional regulator